MTDPTPRPDDELVSAVLDGEATADERARVEADPEARQRLAELRAVRDLLAAPVAVPGAAREAAIAAALAQFDQTSSATGSGAHGAWAAPEAGSRAEPAATSRVPSGPAASGGDELAARRARRSRGGPFLAAAAAIVVLVIGAGVIVRILNPPSELTSATSAGDAADVTTTTTRAELPAATPDGATDQDLETSTTQGALDPPSTTLPGQVAPTAEAQQYAAAVTVDLGVVGSPRDLRDRMLDVIDARFTSDSGPAPTTAPRSGGSGSSSAPRLNEFASCASFLDAVDPELDQLLAVGAATYEGQPATIYAFSIDQVVHPAANGSIRIYAVDATTCATRSVLTVR